MRSTVKRVGSILVLAAVIVALFATPAMAVTPKSLDWPVAKQAIQNGRQFGYAMPRPAALAPSAVWPYQTNIATQLKAVPNSPVVAAAGGTVVWAGPANYRGIIGPLVIIAHVDEYDGSAFTTQYLGVQPTVKVGQVVQEGEQIALMNPYGAVLPDHLSLFHFSVRNAPWNGPVYQSILQYYPQNYYGMWQLPANPAFKPLLWHFPEKFVDPVPLFED